MVNYSQLIGGARMLIERPSMVDSPAGRVPAKAPRWDLADTEGCGGGNSFSWCSWMFLGYVDIYRRRKSVRGATRGPRGRGRALGGAPSTLVAFLMEGPSLLDLI